MMVYISISLYFSKLVFLDLSYIEAIHIYQNRLLVEFTIH